MKILSTIQPVLYSIANGFIYDAGKGSSSLYLSIIKDVRILHVLYVL